MGLAFLAHKRRGERLKVVRRYVVYLNHLKSGSVFPVKFFVFNQVEKSRSVSPLLRKADYDYIHCRVFSMVPENGGPCEGNLPAKIEYGFKEPLNLNPLSNGIGRDECKLAL